MSYIINKTDGSVLTEVVDGTIDQLTTDITIVGKNATTYGELFNENFIKILENFANTTQPNKPLEGQLWYDTTEGRLKVYDGSGLSNYFENIFWVFNFANVEINNFYAKTQNNSDIIIGWNEDFQSYNSEEKISKAFNTDDIYSVLDQITIQNTYKNNLTYVNIDSYDIYASTEDNVVLPASDIINKQQNQFYKLSIKKEFFNNLYEFNIKPIGFEYDVPYYFKAVPFSSVGSGKAISFGPNVFKSFTSTGEEIQTSNQFQLAHGESSMKLDFLTGEITTTGLSTIDIVERGVYNTILYTTQITDSNNTVYSSELKIVDTNNSLIGSGISFSEYAISNNSRVVYSATADQSYIYVHVQNVFPTGIYKLYKTLI